MSLALFRHLPVTTGQILVAPQWPYIKSGLARNLLKIMNYYKSARIGVRGGHPLLRYLIGLAVPKALPLDRYYSNVDSICMEFSISHGFTSSLSAGRIHQGNFYGPNIPEIILATNESFDPEYVTQNWEDVTSVKVLLHPKTDLNIQYLVGKDYSDEYGLCVIHVNVAMLAVQYRAFVYAQARKTDPVTRESINRFLGGYVIPNMMPSHLDWAIFNRLIHQHYDQPFGHPRIQHAVALADYARHVDDVNAKTLKNMRQTPARFDNLLNAVPLVTNDHLSNLLLMPDVMPTRQVSWALIATRLRALGFLIDIAGSHVASLNRPALNQCMRALEMYDSATLISEKLPVSLAFEAEKNIRTLLDANDRDFL